MPNLLIRTKQIILLLGDLVSLYLALYLTLWARYGFSPEKVSWERHLSPFSLLFFAWLLVFFINDFYDLRTSYNTNNLINLLFKIFIINGIIAVILFYFFSPFIDSIRPQRILIIDLIFSLVIVFFWRKIFFNFIKSEKITNRVLIIGDSPLGDLLFEEINRRSQLGYTTVKIEQAPDDLKAHCLANNINILVSTNDLKNDEKTARKIFDCLSLGVEVYNLNSFYEQITNRIPVEHIEHSWFLENLTEHSKKFYDIVKRALDVFLAIIGLVAAVPLSPIIALIIKLESPGPIIFKQIRVGKNGKEFLAMKFRSMVDGAEQNGPQWATKNDPRMTRFGSLMRKTRLDEIPQLLNILRGEMSFVGPRPERPEFVSLLSEKIPFYRERLLVKPGLTGWAQLNGPAYGGSEQESLEKLKYDLYY
ncbi:MAG: sugar transferase, partial [Patescibacteria group bacterium]